ncbi:MAG: NAD(P)H-hydrate dehydratase [Actinomycetota bacterium]|nr:NAD(P)H-hydrate dehydratase [Actinomycetota bacterium]
MKRLATPEQMAQADRETIASGVPAEVLMERAGFAVARAVLDLLGGRYGKRVVVVCGTANNGGDGFVAGRALHAQGCAVRCLVVGDIGKIKGAAAHHLDLMRRRGVSVEAFERDAVDGDAIVDAIFGTGFHGKAEGAAQTAIEAMNQSGAPIVAADIPSGLDGATGRAEGAAVQATVTVTMGTCKVGLVVGDGPLRSGRVEVADIGLHSPRVAAWLVGADDLADYLPRRGATDHKRSGSSVAILAGSDEVTGAPLLAARGAGRMGSGYVTLGSTPRAIDAASVRLPEVLKRRVTDADHLGPESVDELKDVLDRATVLAIGPGLGQGPDQRALVERVVSEVDLPLVIDADGLNVLAGNTEVLRRRSEDGRTTVLTPHPGELATLLESSVAEIEADRLASVRNAYRRFGCIVVLKGHPTVIAGPARTHEDGASHIDDHGEVFVVPSGGPVLATAGTGDVLTGAIASLFDRNRDRSAFKRACAGVFVHGVAGEVIASEHEVGALAWDVAEALPRAIDTLKGIT